MPFRHLGAARRMRGFVRRTFNSGHQAYVGQGSGSVTLPASHPQPCVNGCRMRVATRNAALQTACRLFLIVGLFKIAMGILLALAAISLVVVSFLTDLLK